MTDHDGDPGIEWAEANAANDDGEAVMRAVRADEAGACEQHGADLPCARCAADDAACALFLHRRKRIAELLAERVQAAQLAVGVLARYIDFEAAEDEHEIGSAELADAGDGAATAAAALRGVKRVADLFAARAAHDLAEAKRDARG